MSSVTSADARAAAKVLHATETASIVRSERVEVMGRIALR